MQLFNRLFYNISVQYAYLKHALTWVQQTNKGQQTNMTLSNGTFPPRRSRNNDRAKVSPKMKRGRSGGGDQVHPPHPLRSILPSGVLLSDRYGCNWFKPLTILSSEIKSVYKIIENCAGGTRKAEQALIALINSWYQEIRECGEGEPTQGTGASRGLGKKVQALRIFGMQL